MELISIYLHIPFCEHRCSYCDFNSYAGMSYLIPEYVHALCSEIQYVGRSAGAKLSVHTIYFGGGTPSLLPLQSLERIMRVIADNYSIQMDCEITLEVNPGTVTKDYLKGVLSLGVRRLSIGMQSAHSAELRLLDRIHTFPEVLQSATWARQAGCGNLNLDLIYGLPDQKLDDWMRSLELALGIGPEHLSLYALTLDESTKLAQWITRGLVTEPDPDLAADMYELAEEKLDQSGFQSYEISNWALKDTYGQLISCRHNLQYWRGKPYLGFGAGAHGYSDQVRTVNVNTPAIYINNMQEQSEVEGINFPRSPANIEVTCLTPEEELAEYMMMGLRLTEEGVGDADFMGRFGVALRQRFGAQIQRLVDIGLLEWIDNPESRLRLTRRGRLLGNQVFREFV